MKSSQCHKYLIINYCFGCWYSYWNFYYCKIICHRNTFLKKSSVKIKTLSKVPLKVEVDARGLLICGWWKVFCFFFFFFPVVSFLSKYCIEPAWVVLVLKIQKKHLHIIKLSRYIQIQYIQPWYPSRIKLFFFL